MISDICIVQITKSIKCAKLDRMQHVTINAKQLHIQNHKIDTRQKHSISAHIQVCNLQVLQLKIDLIYLIIIKWTIFYQ